LKKYQRAVALDAAAWYQHILIRQVCSSQLRDMRDANPLFTEWHGPVKQALAILRENPLADLTQPLFHGTTFSFCSDFGVDDKAVVRSMTFWDLCESGATITDEPHVIHDP